MKDWGTAAFPASPSINQIHINDRGQIFRYDASYVWMRMPQYEVRPIRQFKFTGNIVEGVNEGNLSYFSRCWLLFGKGNEVISRKTFSSPLDLQNYIAVLQSSHGMFYAAVFDVVDTTVSLDLFGGNSLYGSLRGRNRHFSRTPEGCAVNAGVSGGFTSKYPTLVDIGRKAIQTMFGVLPGTNNNGVIWYGSQHRIYHHPKTATPVANFAKTCYNTSNGTYIISGGDYTVGAMKILIQDHGATPFFKDMTAAYLDDWLNSRSMVAVYALTQGTGRAVYLKPMGIDRVVIPKIADPLVQTWFSEIHFEKNRNTNYEEIAAVLDDDTDCKRAWISALFSKGSKLLCKPRINCRFIPNKIQILYKRSNNVTVRSSASIVLKRRLTSLPLSWGIKKG